LVENGAGREETEPRPRNWMEEGKCEKMKGEERTHEKRRMTKREKRGKGKQVNKGNIKGPSAQ